MLNEVLKIICFYFINLLFMLNGLFSNFIIYKFSYLFIFMFWFFAVVHRLICLCLKSILDTYFYYISLIHLILKGDAAAAAAKLLQSCTTLCDPIDGSLPGSSVPGILQGRILEQVAISFSNACMHAESLHLCLTRCDPMDSSPSGSSVHRISRQEYWSGLPFPSLWRT